MFLSPFGASIIGDISVLVTVCYDCISLPFKHKNQVQRTCIDPFLHYGEFAMLTFYLASTLIFLHISSFFPLP